jgi:hypothetical protein
MIAHRLTTLDSCDLFAEVKNGRVVVHGSLPTPDARPSRIVNGLVSQSGGA